MYYLATGTQYNKDNQISTPDNLMGILTYKHFYRYPAAILQICVCTVNSELILNSVNKGLSCIMYMAPGFRGHELWIDVAMSSCDTHMPVSVYRFPCHFPSLICLSLSGSLQPCFIRVHLSEPTHLSQSGPGPSHCDANMNARLMLVYVHVCVRMRGRVSSDQVS